MSDRPASPIFEKGVVFSVFPMNSIAWWPSLFVLGAAAVIDIFTRRIPNWLSVPFLLSGLVIQAVTGGWHGMGSSLGGFGLALLLFGPPCFIRLMGMGDLKLAAGVGAWIGPGQFVFAFLVTGMAGGIMAAAYALRHRLPRGRVDDAGELVVHPAPVGFFETIQSGGTRHLSIPYAPAIAIGTLFSFFAQ